MALGRYLRFLAVVLFVFASGLAAILSLKPQREAKEVLTQLRRIEVGKTTLNELENGIESGGYIGKRLNSPDGTVVYAFEARNRVLHALHLSPATRLLSDVTVQHDVVTKLTVVFNIGEWGEYALIMVGQAPPGTVEHDYWGCSQNECITVLNNSHGRPMQVYVRLSPSVMLTERNRYLQINSNCLMKFHGCKDAAEVLPGVELR